MARARLIDGALRCLFALLLIGPSDRSMVNLMKMRTWMARVSAAVMLVGLFVIAGCSTPEPLQSVSEPTPPSSLDLSTPEASVRTYLEWTSFSYRMANSEIATPAMTAEEWVGVDSYIEKNRQEGKGIEQFLASLEIRSDTTQESAATVATLEDWDYRYFSLDTLAYVSDPLTASYETTYTLVLVGQEWFVHDVEARPLTPLE